MAKLIFSLVRQMFRFAVDRDYIEADPTASIRKVKIGGPDTERERVLSRAEIQTLFHQLPTARLMPQTEAAVWIVLATLCRIGELSSAKWSDIDLDNRHWRIPETKNGKPHEVCLSDFAVEHFRKVKALSDPDIAWVYPGRDKKKALSSKSITKQLPDAAPLFPVIVRARALRSTRRVALLGSACEAARTPVLPWTFGQGRTHAGG